MNVVTAISVISAVLAVISFALGTGRYREVKRAIWDREVRRTIRRAQEEGGLIQLRSLKPGESAQLSGDLSVRNASMRMQVEVKVTRPARSRSAIGLTEFAASVLPACDRDRYAEEFRAELQDLAQSGAGRLRQLLYGLRQIRGILQVRYALRSPRRKSATP